MIDDLLTRLVITKEQWIPRSDLDRVDRDRPEGTPLSLALHDRGLLTREQFLRIGPTQAKRSRLRELTERERSFWDSGPERVGRIRIVREVFRGSRTVVYEGYEEPDGDRVAVKLPTPDRSFDLPELERFCRQARILSHLVHPGLIRVRAFAWEESIPYLVMDYVPGETADRRIGTSVDSRDAAREVALLAGTLHYLHEDGILHCDMKPDNVIQDAEGRLYLTDFGLCRPIGEEDPEGAIVGTPEYLAPEVARGKPHSISSDVFALGATLFAWVIGHPPYGGKDAHAVLKQAAKGRVPDPARLRDDLHPLLVACIRRATRRRASDRHPDADAVRADLERIAS